MKRKKIILASLFIMGIIPTLICGVDYLRPSEHLASVGYAKESQAEIINNSYERDDVFIADIILDKAHGFDIDNTGKKSIASLLQTTIDNLYDYGGGTIYLPAGEYLIDSRVTVKPYVNIRGDYRDPDNSINGDYGTIIVNGLPTNTNDTGETANLFRLAGSSAISGLTFFYPLQFMENPVPYGYAIEIPGGLTLDYHNCFTIKDITFINAYKGICCSVTPSGVSKSITHEQLHLQNIKGTVLREGFHLTNSSEVGVFTDIHLSPDYWAKAGEKFNQPDRRNVVDFTSQNGVGFILGDLEWQEIRNITIEDFHTGIYVHDGTRTTTYHMGLIAQFYELHIVGSKYGIYVEALYDNLPLEIASSTIYASDYALINHSPKTQSGVKLSGVSYKGKIAGFNLRYDANLYSDVEHIKEPSRAYKLPRLVIYNALDFGADNKGINDVTPALQAALDDAHSAGGGIVYLPAGFYRLEGKLTIYENTQLRGCTSYLQKDITNNSCGTWILVYTSSVSKDQAATAQSIITIDGDNSGISGLRMVMPQYNVCGNNYTVDTLPCYPYLIRGKGNNNYVTNVYLDNAYHGVDFSKTNNCLLFKVLGCFLGDAFYIGGENPVVDSCLSNPATLLKISSNKISDFKDWPTGDKLTTGFQNLQNNVTRLNSRLMIFDGASNALTSNVFTFASNTYARVHSSSVKFINCGFDSTHPLNGVMFDLTGESCVDAYNCLRDACGQIGTFKKVESGSDINVSNQQVLLADNAGMNDPNYVNNHALTMDKLDTDSSPEIPKIYTQPINYKYIHYDPIPPTSSSEMPSSSSEIISSSEMSSISSELSSSQTGSSQESGSGQQSSSAAPVPPGGNNTTLIAVIIIVGSIVTVGLLAVLITIIKRRK